MAAVALTLSTQQVIALVRQLPPDDQLQVLQALVVTLVPDRSTWLQRLHQHGNAQMRQLAAERGQDWDTLDDAARLALVDDLLHENGV